MKTFTVIILLGIVYVILKKAFQSKVPNEVPDNVSDENRCYECHKEPDDCIECEHCTW